VSSSSSLSPILYPSDLVGGGWRRLSARQRVSRILHGEYITIVNGIEFPNLCDKFCNIDYVMCDRLFMCLLCDLFVGMTGLIF
jgi:hypothetical protein